MIPKNLVELRNVSIGLIGNCPRCIKKLGYTSGRNIKGKFLSAGEWLQKDIDEGIIVDDFHFSKGPCEVCGYKLKGIRYVIHGKRKDGELVHLEVCFYCHDFIDKNNL